MNCLALEQQGEVLVVDCGVTFDDRGLGIDVVHPDFTALERYRVAGLFLTHGHEDHIGAIPYFLRRFDVPVYGPRYALGLVRERAAEHEILDHVTLHEVTPRQRVQVGSFEVEPIRVTHSIADATALAIRTDAGLVVHTGDFKFDDAPPDGETFDVARFQALAVEGIRLLLSDSTNIDARGPTGSEGAVGHALDDIVAAAEHAVVVAVFASNVHRLRILGEIARRHGRKLVALGRSVSTHARVARSIARSTGEHAGAPYLDWPNDLVWPADRARELPRRALLGVATGSQGEGAAALARLARGEHPAFDLAAEDVVVMSSRVIPGNEAAVVRVMGDLLRRGVAVRTWWSDRDVHVSGHAHRDEQRRMIELARPRAFVPLHGTLHHLFRHAALARELGVPEVCVLENGDVGASFGHFDQVGPRSLRARARLRAEGLARRRASRARGSRLSRSGPCRRLGRPTRKAGGGRGSLYARRGRRGARRACALGRPPRSGHRRGRARGRSARGGHRRGRRCRGRAPSGTTCAGPRRRVQARDHRHRATGAAMSVDPAPTVGPYLTAKLRAFDDRLRGLLPRILSSSDDDEVVHDLRVALRRTRTVLEIGRSVFGRFHSDEVRRALRDVQRATGALRDEEVLLDLMESLHVEAPVVAEWLEIRRRRERRLRRALVRLVEAGELDRGRRLLEALLAFRVDPSRDRRLAKFARRSATAARRRVDRRRIARVDDPLALHQLRIAYKRLRYVVETFAEALPGDLTALAQPAARMQNRLGSVHDVDVAVGCIGRARSLPLETRRELLAALGAVRAERLAHCVAEAGLAVAVAGPGVAFAHASGAAGLRKTSMR